MLDELYQLSGVHWFEDYLVDSERLHIGEKLASGVGGAREYPSAG